MNDSMKLEFDKIKALADLLFNTKNYDELDTNTISEVGSMIYESVQNIEKIDKANPVF